MSQTIDLGTTTKSVREFIRKLGPLREPIDLVSNGTVVARITPPSELSDAEKRQILDDGWKLVQKARARNVGVPEKDIAKVVAAAVKQVRRRK